MTQSRSGLLRPGEHPPKVTFRLVRELAEIGIPVAAACRVLNVSTSGYYEWLGKPESPRETRNKELAKMIAAIHEESRGTYGWPRVQLSWQLAVTEGILRRPARAA